MSDSAKANRNPGIADPPAFGLGRKLLGGIVFGFVFGFLLQKGGVGTYHILVGQLLLQDWTVVKVMLTAVVVGMAGVSVLRHFGKAKLHLKPTRLGPNIIGGLVFGAGFALLGYCPGTAAAALGQGSWDALFGMAGLVAGSWLYAEFSGALRKTAVNWGDLGKVTLPDLFRLPRGPFIVMLVLALTATLFLLEKLTVR